MMYGLQRNNFQWEDDTYDNLIKKYPNCKSALQWWCDTNPKTKSGKQSSYNISRNKLLKEFIIANPPTFKIANKCCTYAKKEPAKHFLKNGGYTLNITGVRKYENGIRSQNYKSCFYDKGNNDYAVWMPIFWFTDEDKKIYCDKCNIRHSDCYEFYGLTRTGCVGCPFNSKFEEELEVVKKFEPKFYKAIMNVFGQSYEYMRKYREFKKEA